MTGANIRGNGSSESLVSLVETRKGSIGKGDFVELQGLGHFGVREVLASFALQDFLILAVVPRAHVDEHETV